MMDESGKAFGSEGVKLSSLAAFLLILLGLWLVTGFGETQIGIDHDSGDAGIVLVDGTAIFTVNLYGDFELAAPEPYFIFDSYHGFGIGDLGGFFYIGMNHPWFEPGFAICVPFWTLIFVTLATAAVLILSPRWRTMPNSTTHSSPEHAKSQ